jgi:hypothetical protein
VINIIGDSHVHTFPSTKNINVYWLGAKTAFNIWKQNKSVKQIIENTPVEEEIWFCLGEIDCERQIYNKHRETELPKGFLIENTVYLYTEYVRLFQPRLVSIMAVPPQGTVENIFNYPFYSSRFERQQISDLFNLELEIICNNKNIPFVNIWKPGWDSLEPNIWLWPEEDFQEDGAHIKKEIATKYLEDYLKENK